MKIVNYGLLLLAFASIAAAPAQAKQPEIDTSDSALITVDGLYPVRHTRVDVAYAKPDLDLSQYSKVMVAPVSIAYDKRSFELSEEQLQRMDGYFRAALDEQLSENGYEVVTASGRDVLLVEASIVDLYVNRSAEPPVGRSKVFTATSGEMTLIGELKDSMSGETLVRFADRQRPRSYWSRSTSVSEWSEVSRAFRFWAGILHERLDVFHGPAN